MTCGIYLLRFEGTDKVYVGQSINIERRFKDHKTKIKSKISNSKLCDAYKKYGEPILDIILECASDELELEENTAIEIFNSVDNGFNVNTTTSGTRCRAKRNDSAFYTPEQVICAFYLLLNKDNTYKGISDISKIPLGTISSIAQGKVCTWLEEEYPKEYKELLNLIGKRVRINNRKEPYPIVISPNNVEYHISNLAEFCRDNNLQAQYMRKLFNREASHHKKWTLKIN